jgi:hypothetical protein
MALADPQSINSQTLARTSLTDSGGTFRAADGTAVFKVSHVYGRRNRRTVRFEHSKVAADALTAVNTRVGATVYMTVDLPKEGYSVAEANALVSAIATWVTASTGANMAKVLGGES